MPHANAWAIAARDGVVLVDCGLDQPGGLDQLSLALGGAGYGLADVRLLVCTHAHPDHYGQARSVVREAGCELWMHPAHGHATESLADPGGALDARIEVARRCGVPEDVLAGFDASRRHGGTGVAGLVLPDRPLATGVTVDTDLGPFEVHETPGHAPSHVVLHQAERRLLVSGDHLLGRISLFYDVGYTPDPVGEFLTSLDRVEALDARLCLAGHARPFRDVAGHVGGTRRTVDEHLETVRGALAAAPRTPFELARPLVGVPEGQELSSGLVGWGLALARGYLGHLELRGEAVALEGEEGPVRWGPAARR